MWNLILHRCKTKNNFKFLGSFLGPLTPPQNKINSEEPGTGLKGKGNTCNIHRRTGLFLRHWQFWEACNS